MKTDLLNRLVEKFADFPGVGRKTAERFAFYILNMQASKIEELISIIIELKSKIKNCPICNNLTENEICDICRDETRDKSLLCIVEEPKDVRVIEQTGCYKGKYFVLLGALSPLEGIGEEDIKLKELINYVKLKPEIKEIIISTDADAEGEATAHYLVKILRPLRRKLTRIGFGLPVGAVLEFVDKNTLERAFSGRQELG